MKLYCTIYSQPGCYRCPAVKNFIEANCVPMKEMNAMEHMQECTDLGISSTPTALFFDELGKELGRAYDIAGVRKFLDEHKN